MDVLSERSVAAPAAKRQRLPSGDEEDAEDVKLGAELDGMVEDGEREQGEDGAVEQDAEGDGDEGDEVEALAGSVAAEVADEEADEVEGDVDDVVGAEACAEVGTAGDGSEA